MLDTVQQFFRQAFAEPDASRQREVTPELAVAALLSEVLRADYNVDDREIAVLRDVLSRQFSLSPEAVERLMAEARGEVEQAVDHFQYVSLLNEHYTYAQRVELVAAMWRLAYADDELAALEEHRIRRLADLLYVTHSDFIRTKLDVQTERG
ncbi:TerB family tellurite resistance protein [Salinicola aestuarinus]|uniref:tellurite resistance TerB family protein n=1 Tax=Salinicola aestuarinus TaxID=1949082 RepID=UPI000DA12346|nr:TerB family tellurite resistance protein [Salinicola aestuarinus]